jgi:hypothetical protein
MKKPAIEVGYGEGGVICWRCSSCGVISWSDPADIEHDDECVIWDPDDANDPGIPKWPD